MIKAALFVFFFAAFFAAIHLFGWVDLQDLYRYDIQYIEIAILSYIGAYVSAVLTRLVTRRNYFDEGLGTEERIFGRFFGKFLLMHPIFILLPVFIAFLVYPNKYIVQSGAVFLTMLAGHSTILGPTIPLVFVIASYCIAHAFYLTWSRNRDMDRPWWATSWKIIKVLAIIILIRFVIFGIYNFTQNRLYAASSPYRDGDTVTLEGRIVCGARKSEKPGVISERLRSCTRDQFLVYNKEDFEKSDRYMLTYNSKHWTSVSDSNEITITGVFNSHPDYKNRVLGEIELASAESSGGVDLLAISEIEQRSSSEISSDPIWDPTVNDFRTPTSFVKHGKSYDFREYYIARYNPEPIREKSYVAPPVPQNIEPTITTTRRTDGSGHISIYDPSDKWTPAEEEKMYQEAVKEFYLKNQAVPVVEQSSVVPVSMSGYSNFEPTVDTPNPNIRKIMYWPGKINQHWDIATQKWISDPDGTSGASINEIIYCTKWYPDFKGQIRGHALETISTWENGSGTLFTSTKVSVECL